MDAIITDNANKICSILTYDRFSILRPYTDIQIIFVVYLLSLSTSDELLLLFFFDWPVYLS